MEQQTGLNLTMAYSLSRKAMEIKPDKLVMGPVPPLPRLGNDPKLAALARKL